MNMGGGKICKIHISPIPLSKQVVTQLHKPLFTNIKYSSHF